MRNKGITLIALVITIIVLLILAGVTIVTLTGENGILTQANNVKEQTEQSELEEEVKLKIAEKETRGWLTAKTKSPAIIAIREFKYLAQTL